MCVLCFHVPKPKDKLRGRNCIVNRHYQNYFSGQFIAVNYRSEEQRRELWIAKLATMTRTRIWENCKSCPRVRLDTNKHVLGKILRIVERSLMNNNEDRAGAMACMWLVI